MDQCCSLQSKVFYVQSAPFFYGQVCGDKINIHWFLYHVTMSPWFFCQFVDLYVRCIHSQIHRQIEPNHRLVDEIHRGIPIYLYTDLLIHQHTDIRCFDVPLYTNMPICRCTHILMCPYTNILIFYQCDNLPIYDMETCWHTDILIS